MSIPLVEYIALGLANSFARIYALDRYRWRLLRLAGVDIQPCVIRGGVQLGGVGNLELIHIGARTFINTGFRAAPNKGADITIGRDCAIGPNVSLEAVFHNTVWTVEDKWGLNAMPIVIGDRCWIGAGATILAGVTIGEGAIIGAGSVVNKNIEPYTLAAGVPAKPIRSLHPTHRDAI